MDATEILCSLLEERGVEWREHEAPAAECIAFFDGNGWHDCWESVGGEVNVTFSMTPEQAIAATLGREPWVNPTWERWHKSLKHDEIKSIGDAVEQLMYEAIEFGGDMGPNGNTYNGIDEGDVLTSGFINEWIRRFESTLGRDKYSYKQWREISNAVGDAMEYAHNKAIEFPDKADPLWNLDEYVNRILKAAFEGEATLGDADATPTRQGDAGTCHNISKIVDKYGQTRFACSECGAWIDSRMLWNPEYRNGESPWVKDCKLNFCPNCGRRIVGPTTNDVDAEVSYG